jgi:hypothetical protein
MAYVPYAILDFMRLPPAAESKERNFLYNQVLASLPSSHSYLTRQFPFTCFNRKCRIIKKFCPHALGGDSILVRCRLENL